MYPPLKPILKIFLPAHHELCPKGITFRKAVTKTSPHASSRIFFFSSLTVYRCHLLSTRP